MYVVFEDGSRQYRVSEGELCKIDYREVEVGGQVELGRVLLYKNGDDTQIGLPLVEGFRLLAEVVDHPTTKLYIQHFRRRKNSRRLRGHRQPFTQVRIRHILAPGQQPPPAPEKQPAAAGPTTPTQTPPETSPPGGTPGSPGS